jgi:hypothetical protein
VINKKLCLLAISKGDRENMGTETEGCVLGIHFGGLTYAALLWWKKASQISVNRKTAHLQRLACVSITGSMHLTSTAALEVILMVPPLGIYIEGEVRQANYRLNCSGEFTRARFGHSEVFEKMTNEWPSILAPGNKIVTFIAFGRGFLVEPGNIGNFAIRWCDFLHRRFILW